MKNSDFNKQQKAIQTIQNIISEAKAFKETSKITTEKLESRVFSSILNKCPQYIRFYCRGYVHALRETLWAEVEFCYQVNNVWYSTSKDSNKPNLRTLDNQNMKGNLHGHFWKNTEKPYTDITICD